MLTPVALLKDSGIGNKGGRRRERERREREREREKERERERESERVKGGRERGRKG